MVIRQARKEELAAILEIQLAAYRVHTSWLRPEQIPPLNEGVEDIEADFSHKVILVAETGGRIAGSVRYAIKGGVCILERLSVSPDIQRSGIGRQLVGEVERLAFPSAHKVYLETGLLADDLLKFYSALGYSGEAVFKNHYGNFDWIAFSKFAERS